VTALAEAVRVYRRLAHADPAEFEPALAGALWNFAWIRSRAGVKLPQALAAIRQSVSYEALARQRPDDVREDLAGARTVLAGLLDRVKQRNRR
jgi:hypothetical protein